MTAEAQPSPNLEIAGNPLRAIRNMDYVIVFAATWRPCAGSMPK
jgi:hypothetical protein